MAPTDKKSPAVSSSDSLSEDVKKAPKTADTTAHPVVKADAESSGPKEPQKIMVKVNDRNISFSESASYEDIVASVYPDWTSRIRTPAVICIEGKDRFTLEVGQTITLNNKMRFEVGYPGKVSMAEEVE